MNSARTAGGSHPARDPDAYRGLCYGSVNRHCRLQQAIAYGSDADGKLGKGADHTEVIRYAERLAGEGS